MGSQMLADSLQPWGGAQSYQKSKNRMSSLRVASDPHAKRKPDFYVGIFNVNTKPLTVQRQWGVGTAPGENGTQASICGLVKIPGREEGKLYSSPVVLRDIEHFQKLQPGSDEIILQPISGEFMAQDLCNSNDPYGSWKTYRPITSDQQQVSGNIGSNYYERGIFWCRLTTPDAEPDLNAVEFAIAQLERTYQGLIEEANRFYQQGAQKQVEICEPHHEAAAYFIAAGHDLNLPWHATLTGGLVGQLAAKRKADAAAAKVAPKV
jgi:hypothetical protein